MVKHAFVISVMMAAMTGGISAGADDDAAKPSKAEQRLAAVMEKYQSTGEEKNCIHIQGVRDTNVIDDQTIFFKVNSDTGYLNHLPNRCSRLGTERRFAYKVTTSQLCNVDIITVLDSGGQSWNSCGLGKFELLTKKAPPAEGN